MRRIFVRVPVVWMVHRWGWRWPQSGVPAGGAAGDDDDDGRDLGMAGADGLPGLFQHGQHAAGGLGVPAWHAGVGPWGAVGPGLLWPLPWVGGQVFVGFGDAPEPVDGPGIGVVAVGVVLAGELAVGLLDIGQGGV